MLSSLGPALRLLVGGLVLLVTLRCRPERLRCTGAEPVWIAAIAIAVWAGHDWLSAEADRAFEVMGLATVLGAVAVLVGAVMSLRSPARVFDAGAVVGMIAAVAAWIGALAIAALLGWGPFVEWLALPRAQQELLWPAWQGLQIAVAAWTLLVMLRLGRIAGRGEAGEIRAHRLGPWLACACIAAAVLPPLRPMFSGASAADGTPGLLHMATQYIGAAVAEKQPPQRARLPRIDVEATYARQPALVRRSLAALAPSRPDRPEIYFVGAATFAGEAVFMREVLSARAIVDERLGTRDRSMLLINHRETLADVPLANTTNLETTLTALASVMDPDKDLLFLYITSHGSPGEIAVQLPGFSPNQLTPERLQRMLAASRIKHRLIVLSACYSGSFIPALAGHDTVVLTAARPDRTSFGCSDEREWTYFGDAFFNHALRQTHSIGDAFAHAKTLISKWEADLKVDPSEPQIAAGRVAQAKLDEISARMAGERDGAPATER